MPECEVCTRKFVNTTALKEHIKHTQAQAQEHLALCCLRCNSRPFPSSLAKQQHLIWSEHHRICHICPEFWDYNTKKGIKGHFKLHHFGLTPLKSELPTDGTLKVTDAAGTGAVSPASARAANPKKAPKPPSTPLDKFFESYESFPYVSTLPPTTSYQNLISHFGWAPRSAGLDNAKAEYQAALKAEVSVWFGKEDDLEAWHTLCRAVGIHKPPADIEGCTQALRTTHVNIVDLIQWGREGELRSVRVFKTQRALVNYSVKNGKIFPSRQVQANGETNVVLRHLLRHFFSWSK